MYSLKTLNKIAKIGLDHLDSAKFTHADDVTAPDGILVRSASLHEYEFNDNLLAIARAGAGVNNIPLDKCSENGIVVFNTPGANANAVKELVIAGLFLASRKIYDGIEWAKTLTGDDVAKQVEKGKSSFVGPEILGKKLGVIGLGAIGVMVANAAHNLGMDVCGYDPYISIDAAWGLSRAIHKAQTIEEIFAECDYITIHVPLNDSTKYMINKDTLFTMKDGVRILNFSRADLVNTDDIKEALESGKVACYITDFPNQHTINVPGIVSIPHLGASTPESEDNCAVMAVKEISAYMLTGSIKNSVNFPNVELSDVSGERICVLHKNIPNIISGLSSAIGSKNINIENFQNKSRGEYAYSVFDVNGNIPDDALCAIKEIDGVIKVRLLKA